MTEIDFDKLQPLRVAAGSHQRGSGKGCAMNVISYITGEAEITDFPECSNTDLARVVQVTNDAAANPVNQLLSPEDAITVVDLGMMTVGTAGAWYALGYLNWDSYWKWVVAREKTNGARCRMIISWQGLSTSYTWVLPEAEFFSGSTKTVQTPNPIPPKLPEQEWEEAKQEMFDAARVFLTEYREKAGLDAHTPADTAALEKTLIAN